MRLVLAFLLLIAGCATAEAARVNPPWRITKDHWDAADEEGFGRFVTALGDSGCSSSQSCLRDPANPYRASDGRFLDIDVDCAKLPYLLRAYYAWKNGLPFSYADGVAGSRFGRHSNRLVSRAGMIDHGRGIDAPTAIRTMLDDVFSGTFRTDAARDDSIPSDFYAPALQPGSIHPGTVIYDTNAHVGIVYRVDAAGRIYYMDAHPDFTISRSVYGPQFGLSPAALGGGLKNWRPQQLQGGHVENGALMGGHYALARNSQIPDFSLVQYLGTEDEGAPRWRYHEAQLGYYEYARVAVSGGKTDFNPVYELQATMGTLCNDLNDRAQAVNQAVANGATAKLHPSANPANIYNSDGDGAWEAYATPARDARLRGAFVAFRQELERMIGQWLNRDPRTAYDGLDLKTDLLAAYDRQSLACTITILTSDKHPLAMSFDDIAQHLFAMSFDPYNCVELRWGIVEGAGGSGCPDQAGKRRWYGLEEQARHVTDPDSRTIAGPRDTDIRGLIAAMPARAPFVQPMPGGGARRSPLR